jgi:hypothetical protein
MSSVRPASDNASQIGLRQFPSHLLRNVASLFEQTAISSRATALTWAALVAILIVGAGVRLWGLDNVGLHGDEETMAMPTMHIIKDGQPLLPSGMYYPRAVAQLYLMAASVDLFGESEWAFRLPSVICGVLLILLAYGVGRRFLQPAWNLAFTAAVALLPEFIVDAQTARMYSFLIASIAGYMMLLFAWERTDRVVYLAAAVAVLMVGMQFHTLAVFAAFMALYPGIVRGELHKVLLGGVAFAAIVAGFVSVDHWIGSHYPDAGDVQGDDGGAGGPQAGEAIPRLGLILLALAATAAAAVSTFMVSTVAPRIPAIAAGVLIALGLLAQFAYWYHSGIVLIAAGIVVALRYGTIGPTRLIALASICAVIAAIQLYLLNAGGVGSLRQMLGAMTGRPSVWPLITVAQYSLGAALLLAAGVVVAAWRLAKGRQIPDFMLFMVLAVWVPLLLIGVFKWSVPLRYTAVQALPFLLTAFAAAQWLLSLRARQRATEGRFAAIVAAAACVLVVNPAAVARTVNSGYESHPDHQGAAAFIQSLPFNDRDIVIAEDVLQQTYYLGHVDYWLQARDVAGMFVRNLDGQLADFYTNTPLIGTAEDLQRLIDQPDRGAIYVIGSGENQEDGRRRARGPGLAEMLESPRFRVVWRGRDGLTTVLMIPAPSREK